MSRSGVGTHYFTPRPRAPSRPQQIRSLLRGRDWVFTTDRGVFAKDAVDAGTRLLIETMRIAPADHVLDVGCGYGPLGLAAAVLASSGQAVLVDINERAVDLATQNARLNNVPNVEILLGDGCAPVRGRHFSVVVTNPPIRTGKTTLRRLVREAWEVLAPGGRLYFVARTSHGAKTLAREVAALFGAVTELRHAHGYRAYEAVKAPAEAGEPVRPNV